MLKRQKEKDPIESKRGNEWIAQDPSGNRKDGTKSTGGAGFGQGEGCQNVHKRECACWVCGS